jgi:hypothetical protein
MKPSTILYGILLGSVGAIAFGLLAVLVIFVLLADEQPRVAGEIPELGRAAALFAALTLVAVPAFIGSLRGRTWRHVPMGLLYLGIAGVGWYYWPV